MEYTGVINPDKMCKHSRQAYLSWNSQRTRCYNPRHPTFKNYGARGIQVRYSSREFVGWWLHHIKTFKGTIPTAGRIDHDGHYEFCNILMQDKADNTREVLSRRGSPRKKRIIETVSQREFDSIIDAAKSLGIMRCTIRRSIKNGRSTLHGYVFKHIGGD